MIAYYYLHTNGSLIYKPAIAVESDPDYFVSDFCKKVWRLNTENKRDAVAMLVEAKMLNANEKRIKELEEKWNVTDADYKRLEKEKCE